MSRIDFKRYRRLRWFVARAFVHALFWDVLLALPVLRAFRRPATPRWQEIARRYRGLATEMGGFLIKLGQFLSVRADLLPVEITRELAGLQDDVAPGPFAEIAALIEAELGRPLAQVFDFVDPVAVGAASLAQVHRARLPGGEAVVVKVLRPGIEVSVETDLEAVRLALRLLKVWKKIRRRVDLERVGDEIESTTRRELDMIAEGKNAERFAAEFRDDPRVEIPAVHWGQTSRRVLTLQDVGYLKIGDRAALVDAGIDLREVALTIYRIYLQQVFVNSFVHADPHPGNLFIHPAVPEPAGAAPGAGPARGSSSGAATGFRIAFVDFGMVADIPAHLRDALREYAIGIGTRDAARVIRAYDAAGALLPGADRQRLEEAHEALFDRFWGVPIGDLRRVAFSQAGYFFHAYRDLLREAPFQVQVDLLFVARAMGMLAGLATQLDPEFDPWAETVPFAKRLAREGGDSRFELWSEIVARVQRVLQLPFQLETFLSRALAGSLKVHASELREADQRLGRLERHIQTAGWLVVGCGCLICGSLFAVAEKAPAPWFFGVAGLALLAAIWRRA